MSDLTANDLQFDITITDKALNKIKTSLVLTTH